MTDSAGKDLASPEQSAPPRGLQLDGAAPPPSCGASCPSPSLPSLGHSAVAMGSEPVLVDCDRTPSSDPRVSWEVLEPAAKLPSLAQG